ncbi:carbon storage regulator CsrA [Phycisphaerales bacterium AB-hyl4]|uniref:Translational regulator CsrA n=1 Tax=Natronomicrosphaera hydrolytica TaxID=3242702 RepID=A0ABV4U5X9_9BACT
MLVLSRQRDETIMIGDEVEITIVDIRGDKVRLGITAPRAIQVHRKEVYEAIRRENADAARVQVEDLRDMDRQLQDNHRRRPGETNGAHRRSVNP